MTEDLITSQYLIEVARYNQPLQPVSQQVHDRTCVLLERLPQDESLELFQILIQLLCSLSSISPWLAKKARNKILLTKTQIQQLK